MSSTQIGWLMCLGNLAFGIVSVLWFALRAKRAAAGGIAAAETDARAPALAEGPITLRGTVRADSSSPPLRLRITQEGKERRRGAEHEWRQVTREIEARPFWLDLSLDGGAVLVEPSAGVLLVADLERTEHVARDRRVRIAEVRPGDRLAVAGQLTRGRTPGASDGESGSYRGEGAAPSMGWVLRAQTCARPGASGPAREAERVSGRYQTAALLAAVMTVLTQGMSWVTFYDLALHGVPCVARVVDRDADTWRGRLGRRHTHYDLIAETTDACPDPGRRLECPASRTEFREVEDGVLVDFFLVPNRYAAVPGSEASLGVLPSAVLGVASLVLLVFLPAGRRRPRWWDGAPLHERGNGPLPPVEAQPEPASGADPPAR